VDEGEGFSEEYIAPSLAVPSMLGVVSFGWP
jgi:hypothetical protein